MTAHFSCDGPGCAVDMAESQLVFVVHVIMPALEPIEASVDGESVQLASFEEYRDRHFHSIECMIEWGFARRISEQESAT